MYTALNKKQLGTIFLGGGGIGFSCDCLHLTQRYDNNLVFTTVDLNIIIIVSGFTCQEASLTGQKTLCYQSLITPHHFYTQNF